MKTIAREHYSRDKDRKIICYIKLNSRIIYYLLIPICARTNRESYIPRCAFH